jgi:O-methyltransferase
LHMDLRDVVRRFLRKKGSDIAWHLAQRAAYPPDFSLDQIELCSSVRPYTMTSPERIVALAEAVETTERNQVPGAYVECGVWRGGSSMVMAHVLRRLGNPTRELYLFDTFAGMVEPTAHDRKRGGKSAGMILKRTERRAGRNVWCIAGLADVRQNLASTGYPIEQVRFVEGKVEDTIPAQAPEQIALLRLDTDWYASTRHELEQLYPRLSPGGIVIIDDYGHWEGARKAVDEYLAGLPSRPHLFRLDYTGRGLVKS